MANIKSSPRRVDALVTRLEELLLSAPASELKAASREPGAMDGVRRVIDDHLARAEACAPQLSRGGVSPGVLRQTAVPARARAVFGKDNKSNQDKVDEMISKLAGNRKESKKSKK
jgi:hypothetical protein